MTLLNSAILLVAITSSLGCPGYARAESPPPQQTDVFVAGRDGYRSYRIPSLCVSRAGTLLAFCEGRKHSSRDSGDIDLLLKRSEDGGRTWTGQQVIWDDGDNTCGNPCCVVDQQTGTIWLLMTHNLGADTEAALQARAAHSTRTVWLTHSEDDGRTWSTPSNITAAVKDPAWTWYATGPGVGIQLQRGSRAGRLVIPCDHTLGTNIHARFSHVIYSDDHGSTWKLGGSAGPEMNECQVVELAEDQPTLLLDMRSYLGEHCRAESFSHDAGLTWTAPRSQAELVDSVCQASILRCTWPSAGQRSRLLFSNPASEQRRNLTVRLSDDEARSWSAAKTLQAGPAAYSCLAMLPNGSAACLYERGDKTPYEKITFASFTLAWLTDGR